MDDIEWTTSSWRGPTNLKLNGSSQASATSVSARVCRTVGTCEIGTFITLNATATVDLACGPCGGDTYQPAAGSRPTACMPQPTCGAREFMSPPSTTRRRTCTECPAGWFQNEMAHRNLECKMKTSSCPPGERLVPGVGEIKSCVSSPALPIFCNGGHWVVPVPARR